MKDIFCKELYKCIHNAISMIAIVVNLLNIVNDESDDNRAINLKILKEFPTDDFQHILEDEEIMNNFNKIDG